MKYLEVDGRMRVGELADMFKSVFGGTLRVYDGDSPRNRSDEKDHLNNVCEPGASPSGQIACPENMTVGQFCETMRRQFGLLVKVASVDDWVLVPDELLLANLLRIPKQARKSDIEKLITIPNQLNRAKAGYLYYGSFDRRWFEVLRRILRNSKEEEDGFLDDFDNDIIHLIGSNEGEPMEEMVDDGIYVDEEYPNGYIVFYRGKEVYAIW